MDASNEIASAQKIHFVELMTSDTKVRENLSNKHMKNEYGRLLSFQIAYYASNRILRVQPFVYLTVNIFTALPE